MKKQFDVNLDEGKVEVEVFTKTEAALSTLEETYKPESLPDAKTKAGYEFVAEGAKKLTKLRTTLEKTRKEIKQPYLDAGKLIDGEAKRITARLVALEEPLKSAKKEVDDAEERKKQERINRQKEKIQSFYNLVNQCRNQPVSVIEEAIEDLTAIDCQDFYDLRTEALEARNDVLEKLGELLNDTLERQRLEEENKRLEAAAAVEKRINALKNIPIDMLNAASEELAEKAAQIAEYAPAPEEFGDRFEEMLQEKVKVVTNLEAMAENKRIVEEAEAQKAKESEAEAAETAQEEPASQPEEPTASQEETEPSAAYDLAQPTPEQTAVSALMIHCDLSEEYASTVLAQIMLGNIPGVMSTI